LIWLILIQHDYISKLFHKFLFIDQYIDKQDNCNKEKIGCLHAKSIIKNEKNRKSENIQKYEEGNKLKMLLENWVPIRLLNI